MSTFSPLFELNFAKLNRKCSIGTFCNLYKANIISYLRINFMELHVFLLNFLSLLKLCRKRESIVKTVQSGKSLDKQSSGVIKHQCHKMLPAAPLCQVSLYPNMASSCHERIFLKAKHFSCCCFKI